MDVLRERVGYQADGSSQGTAVGYQADGRSRERRLVIKLMEAIRSSSWL